MAQAPTNVPQTAEPIESGTEFRLPTWVLLAMLAVVTCIAYSPSFGGQILWDADAHIPKLDMRSLDGLYRIWFDVRSTQQYYPLLFSWFWLQYQLWGDAMLGYHLVNLALHLTAVYLIFIILRKLKIP